MHESEEWHILDNPVIYDHETDSYYLNNDITENRNYYFDHAIKMIMKNKND